MGEVNKPPNPMLISRIDEVDRALVVDAFVGLFSFFDGDSNRMNDRFNALKRIVEGVGFGDVGFDSLNRKVC